MRQKKTKIKAPKNNSVVATPFLLVSSKIFPNTLDVRVSCRLVRMFMHVVKMGSPWSETDVCFCKPLLPSIPKHFQWGLDHFNMQDEPKRWMLFSWEKSFVRHLKNLFHTAQTRTVNQEGCQYNIFT
ncbi:hypothetical protein AMECASPLE_024347 [Ameca splendens]|uniref:Uncharacterized protein n=1 Tax=Ameca splendens TaxID=208324 RepID=A0ABV0ZDC2_9TELE